MTVSNIGGIRQDRYYQIACNWQIIYVRAPIIISGIIRSILLIEGRVHLVLIVFGVTNNLCDVGATWFAIVDA